MQETDSNNINETLKNIETSQYARSQKLGGMITTANAGKEDCNRQSESRNARDAFIEDLYDWCFPSGDSSTKLAYRDLMASLEGYAKWGPCRDMIINLKLYRARYNLTASDLLKSAPGKTQIETYIKEYRAHEREVTVADKLKIALVLGRVLIRDYLEECSRRGREPKDGDASTLALLEAAHRNKRGKADQAALEKWWAFMSAAFPTVTSNEATEEVMDVLYDTVQNMLGQTLTKVELVTLMGNCVTSKAPEMAHQIALDRMAGAETHDRILKGIAGIMCDEWNASAAMNNQLILDTVEVAEKVKARTLTKKDLNHRWLRCGA